MVTNYDEAFFDTDFPQNVIDDILVALDSTGLINGVFGQSGGDFPSETGEVAIDNLLEKGWVITVTGLYGYVEPSYGSGYGSGYGVGIGVGGL